METPRQRSRPQPRAAPPANDAAGQRLRQVVRLPLRSWRPAPPLIGCFASDCRPTDQAIDIGLHDQRKNSLGDAAKQHELPGLGKTTAAHRSVIHSQKAFANPETGAHVNPAEAVISQVQRALVGIYHNLGRKHLQRYLDEIVWRWNHREPFREMVKQWTTKAGVDREKAITIWRPIPVVDQMRVLLQGAVGKQVRRSREYGLCWP